MILNKFHIFLNKLGFSEKELSEAQDNLFTYSLSNTPKLEISYFHVSSTKDIFKIHSILWNENKIETFIAIEDASSFVINAKTKPNIHNPLSGKIISFDYGVNSEGFEIESIQEITKDYIDSSYFFDFVIKNKKKGIEVDKDLLLNLITLRNKLLNGNNDDIIHRLILRCLFFKYLEDRNIFSENYLIETLKTGQPSELIRIFNEVAKINGDVFKYENLTESDIESSYLTELLAFFSSDYRTGQLNLFPYQFDKIPVQLISHVYEAFLQSDEKKGKGIYYTPAFIVNFMLDQSLKPRLVENSNISVLDPAVGSGAFLVETFKAIINSYSTKPLYDKKKEILQNQLFGIDIDPKALQIAAFSLYLALLEDEDAEFIREKIKNSHPILPSLIGSNLIRANAITDNVFDDKKFDCILSNPPWGSVEPDDDGETIKERKAIGTKGVKGTMPKYLNVSDYERSQAFLIRVKNWSKPETVFSLIVKNSIFLNDNSLDFRRELLGLYQINYFYELSNYNKILFKKHVIGKVGNKDIVIGATEPCAILVFENKKQENTILTYISPKLNGFSESLNVIHFTEKDKTKLEQSKFSEDDLLWRILVNGDHEGFKLISKLKLTNCITKSCKSGFQPKKEMESLGNPIYRRLLTPTDFERYRITCELKQFNWNQKLRRKPDIFSNNSIVLTRRPLEKDNYKLKSVFISDEEIVFRDDILSLIIDNGNISIRDYLYFLGILNSKLIGYNLFHISPQWGKGEEKRAALRNEDIESLPLTINKLENKILEEKVVSFVVELKKSPFSNSAFLEDYIDELVYNIYGLSEYEKEIIREFYQIKVERTGSKRFVNQLDIETYIAKFTEVFELMLDDNSKLIASFRISTNVGAIIRFSIVDSDKFQGPTEDNTLEVLNFVKSKQLQKADISKIINEDKVKLYDDQFFYLIKSNLFKDWTIRQAIKDAKEEIGLMLSNLPATHE